MYQAPLFLLLVCSLSLTACRRKEQAPASPPAQTAAPAPSAPAQSPAPTPAGPAAAGEAAVPPPAVQPIASTDVDAPTPLTARSISGTGIKKRVSYFYGFTSGAGTVTLTGTGKNAPSAMSNALGASLLTTSADKLCSISLGNTTQDKKERAECRVDKLQPVILRVDLDEDSLDFTVDLDGPVQLAEPGSTAPASGQAAGAGSTDVDAPTRLTGPSVKGIGTQQATSYYYALNGGPGEVRLVADGKNQPTAVARALHVRLLNLRGEELCGASLGNVTRDDRKVTACRMDAREPVILRVDLDPNTIDWRAKVEGAVDFEAYTPPQTITIALNERVLFDSGKSTLKPESKQTLHEAAVRVKKFATAPVTIAGYTDNVGSDGANLTLSQDRAAAVRDYFVGQEGIPADRLAVKGFGKSQPVAENGTDEGRARNRRVEVVIATK